MSERHVEPSRVEMWAMTHPIRYRIFEVLRQGPATAAQLARQLGESSGTVSYHLRMLARAGAIDEDPSLGTRRERWWRRPEPRLVPTDSDLEGRAITARLFAMFFQRDAEARHRFVTGDVSDEWHRAALAGNWLIELSPDQASELAVRLLELVDEYRAGPPPDDAARTLVSVSILPWLDGS
jgi:DNA-binding transcriptional ArsR family regulator